MFCVMIIERSAEMETTLEALARHRASFWQATDCNAWMATEAELLAQLAFQKAGPDAAAKAGHSDYARQIMGIKHEDQFYA